MFKRIRLVLITIVVLLVVFIAVVALQPSTFRIERTATIAAAPSVVFLQVNNFRQWEAWSPWAKRDPNATATFEGPAAGEGAIFRWAGNDEVGEGSMTILESRPSELVRIRLDFIKPFKDTAIAEFTFTPENDQTSVTWAMSGKRNLMAKAVCLFMDMDEMVGGDFEQGLANMKAVVENSAVP